MHTARPIWLLWISIMAGGTMGRGVARMWKFQFETVEEPYLYRDKTCETDLTVERQKTGENVTSVSVMYGILFSHQSHLSRLPSPFLRENEVAQISLDTNTERMFSTVCCLMVGKGIKNHLLHDFHSKTPEGSRTSTYTQGVQSISTTFQNAITFLFEELSRRF